MEIIRLNDSYRGRELVFRYRTEHYLSLIHIFHDVSIRVRVRFAPHSFLTEFGKGVGLWQR